jgi:hypothetical protein
MRVPLPGELRFAEIAQILQLYVEQILRGQMLQYLEEKADVSRSHQKLQATIRRTLSKTAVRDIGYPGGRERRATVATDGRYWFWTEDNRGADVLTKRRLNWFGVLSDRPGVGITVEINTTYEDRNDQTAGFFARDTKTGATYFLHSGRVGGGAKGVGKTSFLTWAAREKRNLVEVVDSSGRIRAGLIVMPVEGRSAANSLVRYIDLVGGFKKAVRNGEIGSKEFRDQQRKFEDYFSEGRGRRTGKRSSDIDYISRHGEIVDALRDWRATRLLPRRSRIVKDVFIDLGIARGNELIEIYEVKPSSDRSSVYSAVGQLLVHGRDITCRKTIVLPHDELLAADLADALRRLSIETVKFRLETNSVTILDPP